MRTWGIVKQTYSLKKTLREKTKNYLKQIKQKHVNIFHENISKFQIYFSETFFHHLSFYVKFSNIQEQMKKDHISLNKHKMRNNFEN